MSKPITCRRKGGKTIDVSSSNQRIQISNASGTVDVLVTNVGTAAVWIEFGGSTVTAVADTGITILPNSAQVFQEREAGGLWVAAIAAGSTGKIYFHGGQGI